MSNDKVTNIFQACTLQTSEKNPQNKLLSRTGCDMLVSSVKIFVKSISIRLHLQFYALCNYTCSTHKII